MSEKADIQEVLNRYSDGVTRRDWAQVATVFAPDATWEVVGSEFKFQGPKVAESIQGIVMAANFLVQMISSTLIEVKGDTATARSTVLEAGEFDAGKYQPYKARMDSYGIYEDTLKKIGGQWKFASRRFTMINLKLSKVEG